MPRKPTTLMLKLASNLFENEAERREFMDALLEGDSKEPAIIVLEERPEIRTFPRHRARPWQPEFIVRLEDHFRPGKHPLHDKGAFYCLDFSSAFAASAMMAIPTPPKRVLDTCSAPGGKAIFSWRAFKPDLIVCNETIRKRTESIIRNLERCKVTRSRVSSCDPSVWARRFPEAFDFVIVDAPCSGQSLMAKGDDVPNCFKPDMIDMNVSRQRRILANAAKNVMPSGHLLYMTCTFTRKENEKVVEWLLSENQDLQAVEVPALNNFRSKYTELPCYRLFPHSGIGAGAFSCLIRKKGELPNEYPSLEGMPMIWSFEGGMVTRAPGPEGPDPETEPSSTTQPAS